jgi:tetratricopeptide (TPR) repeat protein
MHIDRNRSSFGFRDKRRRNRPLLLLWAAIMVAALVVLWRFDEVQSRVLHTLDTAATSTPHPVTLARHGEQSYLNGDLQAAVDYYGQAYAQRPDDLNIALEYVRVLIYRSYTGEQFRTYAGEALAVAQQMPEDDPRTLAALCLAQQENGQVQSAIQTGLRAIALQPDNGPAMAYLALAYYQAERPGPALEMADQAVQAAPDNVDAHRALAISLAYQGQTEAAIQEYEQAIQLHPTLDVLRFELAWYYISQQNYEAALAMYDQVLAQEPEHVKAYVRICYTYFITGEFALAQEACTQAASLDPTYTEAFQWLGKVRYMDRNYTGAAEALGRCVALQEGAGIPPGEREIECYYIQGLSYALLARCDEAMPLLRTALAMNPTDKQKGAINEGIARCIGGGAASTPTPPPPPAATPTPVTVY